MNALASIRNGPLIVISDAPGGAPATYSPLQQMTDILNGHPTTQSIPQEQHLPPIYLLNRTTTNPEHFDATKHAVTPTPTLGMPPTTTTVISDDTESRMPPPARLTPPPTIVRRLHHPELDPNRDAPHPPPDQTTATYTPPDDPPELNQTRRRSQAQISSTPVPKNNHNPPKTNNDIISKKGRPGTALYDAQQPHNDYTLSPPRSPMPSSPPDHWGSEDESSDTPDDYPNLHMVSPMRNDPHERLEQATQGPELQPPPIPSTQGARQRPSPKQPSTKRGPQTPHKSPTPHATTNNAHRGTPDHHKKQRAGIKTPPSHIQLRTEPVTHTNTQAPPPSSPPELPPQITPGHLPHLPNPAAPTPGTTHIHLHMEPTQYPTPESQLQTIPNTTTMEVHHSTPSDTDDMTQEHPATTQGRGFDPHSEPREIPKPPYWRNMTPRAKENWHRKHRK